MQTADAQSSMLVDRLRSALIALGGLVLALGFGFLISHQPRQAVVGLVGMVLTAVVLWRPAVGFLLVVASLPLDVTGTLGSGAGGLTQISLTKIMASLTLLAVAFDTLVRHRPIGWRRFLTPETLLACGLFGIMLLSAVSSPTQESVREMIRQLVLAVFVFVMVYFVDRPGRLRQVAMTLAVVATLVAMQSLYQRVTGPVSVSEQWVAEAGAVLDVGEENVGEMLRTTGTFSHPAWLGLFLSIAVPFTLGLAWTTRQQVWMLIGVGAVGVQLLGILSTYSRMSYIGVGLALVLFTLRRRLGIGAVVLGCTAAVLMFPGLPEDFQNRVYSIIEYRESSSSLSRLAQQMAGWTMFREHPVLGVGPGNFEDEVMRYADRVPVPLYVQPIGAHNMYVEVAAELGVLGLVAVLLVLGQGWRQLRHLRRAARRRGDGSQAMLWECAGIGLIVFAVSALFVHAQYAKEWWVLLGLAAAGRQFVHGSRFDISPSASAGLAEEAADT